MTHHTSNSPDCIFCKIAAKAAPADIVYESDNTLFFRDINPKAAVHVVAIPKIHLNSLKDVDNTNQNIMGKLISDIAQVAKQQGLAADGYRVITNIGINAGQEVDHLHWHILGGETLGPLNTKSK